MQFQSGSLFLIWISLAKSHFEPATGLGQHHCQCDHISPKSQIPEIFHPNRTDRIGEILWVIVATPFLSKRLSEFSATAHGLTTEKSVFANAPKEFWWLTIVRRENCGLTSSQHPHHPFWFH